MWGVTADADNTDDGEFSAETAAVAAEGTACSDGSNVLCKESPEEVEVDARNSG